MAKNSLPKLEGNEKGFNISSIGDAIKNSIFGVISQNAAAGKAVRSKAIDIGSSGISSVANFTKNLFGFGSGKEGEKDKKENIISSGISSAANFTKNLFGFGSGKEGEKGKKQKGLFENPVYYKAYLFRGNRKYALQTILQNIEKKIGTGSEKASGLLTPGSKKEKSETKSKGGKFGFFADLANTLKSFVKIAFQAAKALLVFSAALLVGAFAFKMFSEGINWGSVLLGMGILVGSAILLAKMSKGLMMASLAMVVLAGAMGLLGISLKTFSNLDWNTIAIASVGLAGLGLVMAGLGFLAGNIALGAAAMILSGVALILLGSALQKFSSLDWNTIGIAGASLAGLGLIMAGLGFLAGNIALGALALSVAAIPLMLIASALQKFSSLDWNTIGIAGASLAGLGLVMAGLGLLAGFIIVGAVALSIAAVSLMIFGKAMEFVSVGLNTFMGFLERLQNADWKTIIKSVGMFSLAIRIMGIAFAALGVLIPFIFLGGIALGVMGAALWVFGKIIENVLPTLERFFEVFVHPFIDLQKTFIQAVENIFTKIAGIFSSLMQQDPAHIREVFSELSWGLGKLSLALAAFGAGSAVGGIGAAIGSLFGSGSPLDLISKFSEKATQLEKTQIAMKGIAESLELFNQNVEKVNEEKIMRLAASLDFLSAALWRMSTPFFTNAMNSINFDKIKELSSYGEGVKTLSDALNSLDFSKLKIEEIDTTELNFLTYSLERLRKVLDGFQTESAFDFILNKIENVKRNVRSTIDQISGRAPAGPVEKSTFEIPESFGKILNIRVSEISPDLKPIPVELKVKENFENMTKELKMSSMETAQPIVIATSNNTVIAPDNSQVTNINQEGGDSSPARPMKAADSALLGINGNQNAFA